MSIRQFLVDLFVFLLADYIWRNTDSYAFALVYIIACCFKTCLYL